jgi:hypothetical protein
MIRAPVGVGEKYQPTEPSFFVIIKPRTMDSGPLPQPLVLEFVALCHQSKILLSLTLSPDAYESQILSLLNPRVGNFI